MTPLNDDELESLIQQAKSRAAQPSSGFPARVLADYNVRIARRQKWRRHILKPISIPWPAAVVVATLLVILGAFLGPHIKRRPSELQSHGPSAREALSTSAMVLSLKEFQPVSEIRPRVVREDTR